MSSASAIPAPSLSFGTLFGRLAESMNVGVLILNHRREVEFINLEARRLLGAAEEDTLADCWKPVRRAVEEAISGGYTERGMECEVTFERQRRTHHVFLEIHAIDEEECTGYLVLAKNHKELNNLKSDLHLAAQFRNTGRLYRALAHNLRHPVTAILIRVDLLKNMFSEGGPPPDPALQARSLDIIEQEVRELDQTLATLLDELSPTDAEKKTFCMRRLVTRLARLIEPQARQQGVTLVMHLPDTEEVLIRGRRARMKQAVMNLAVNALEAMPEGGMLRLKLTLNGETACVEVRDDGPGIPSDVRSHIFEEAFTTKKTGTGIGLYLVQETIKQHNGTLELETADGKGTAFRLHLPLVPTEIDSASDGSVAAET